LTNQADPVNSHIIAKSRHFLLLNTAIT
jgi:hypothetical protein